MYLLAKLFKALNSDANPWQLAFGIMFGMIFGLTPLLNLHNLLVLFIVLFFRVNLGTFLLSWTLFTAIAMLIDPLMSQLGEAVLNAPAMHSTWQSAYNTGLGQLSQFAYTLTMGSLVLSLLLAIPLLFISKYLIVQYREHLMKWVEQLQLVQFLKGSRVFELYQRMNG